MCNYLFLAIELGLKWRQMECHRNGQQPIRFRKLHYGYAPLQRWSVEKASTRSCVTRATLRSLYTRGDNEDDDVDNLRVGLIGRKMTRSPSQFKTHTVGRQKSHANPRAGKGGAADITQIIL